MIKLSLSIMHCSWDNKRRQMIKDIEKKIDKSLLYDFNISDDTDREGIWINYKNALNQASPEATHHLVFQDDMMPCDNFIPVLLKLINLYPDKLINFFSNTHAHKHMSDKNIRVFTAIGGTWGGSVILPKKWFNWHKECDYFFSSGPNSRQGLHCDDERLNMILELKNEKVIHITPSLTQHIGNISLIGNEPNRATNLFIDQDPLTINWETVEDLPHFGVIWRTSSKEVMKRLNPSKRDEMLDKYCGGTQKSLIKMFKNRK